MTLERRAGVRITVGSVLALLVVRPWDGDVPPALLVAATLALAGAVAALLHGWAWPWTLAHGAGEQRAPLPAQDAAPAPLPHPVTPAVGSGGVQPVPLLPLLALLPLWLRPRGRGPGRHSVPPVASATLAVRSRAHAVRRRGGPPCPAQPAWEHVARRSEVMPTT